MVGFQVLVAELFMFLAKMQLWAEAQGKFI
jgi:hypothetical protein